MKDDGKEKPGVLIYFDIREPLEILNMEQRGELLTAILDYAADGIAPTFEDSLLRMAWTIVRRGIDRDDSQYRTTILKRKYAIYCRYEKEAGRTPVVFNEWINMDDDEQSCIHVNTHEHTCIPTTTTTSTSTSTSTSTTTPTTTINNKGSAPPAEPADPPKGKRFIKPTLEEVTAYIREKGYAVDPERFYAYYESCGWQVKGRSMRDWKAAIVYWNTRDKQPTAAPAPAAPRKGAYFQTGAQSMSWEEWEAQGIEVDEED